ncbi:TonB-linked outer membrane protein, SusC/RagA family [Catalinimonas alkaloidigena]|uniref:TonB-linked outer membrane protein, SusC/RagA family n=1 Tax=Catalinimonas alkaloidigena TaxID=1075417 RepID=A0A1G9E9L2_9BACT|nr:TonB-dependent receptor [Catalinimonas alkaloidigena]SDK72840.1 TonB-linked outer membrane protein, SusC/RagA family [Catalinimonas alkaloidigena]
MRSLFYVVGFLLSCLSSAGWAQPLASSRQAPSATPSQTSERALTAVLDELKARYQVRFIFETRYLEGKFADREFSDQGNLEKSLKALLKPHNLRHKRLRSGDYAILPTRSRTVEPVPSRTAGMGPPTTQLTRASPLTESSRFATLALPLSVEIRVTGQVTDAQGQGIPGVNVLLKGTASGTVTDVDGNYTLAVPDESAVLVFSSIGYITQEILVGNQTTLNIQLADNVQALSEVVVVGYGTQEKQNVTGAVASIDPQKLNQLPNISIDQALQGQAAGVQVTQGTGAPGDDIRVRIRGVGSINDNSPLYIIDGVPTKGPINTFNQRDIESISVLKDAAAASIYGARAANGVVIITTKSGKSGKTTFNLDSYYGWQEAYRLPKLLNTPQYVEIRNEAIANTNAQRAANGQGPLAISPFTGNADSLPNTDWLDALFRVAPIQSYNLSASGGSERIRFYLAGNYFNQEGIIPNSGFERYSFRSNVNADLSKQVKVGTNLTLTYSKKDVVGSSGDGGGGNGGGIIRYALLRAPAIPLRNANGEYSDLPADQSFFGDGYNPVGLSEKTDNKERRYRLFGNLYAEWEIIKDLKFRSDGGIDFLTGEDKRFNEQWGNFGRINNPNSLSLTDLRTATMNWTNTLSYSRYFGERHYATAVIGTEAIQNQSHFTNASRSNFPDQRPNFRYLSRGLSQIQNSETAYDWALFSLFARATYEYGNRYLLTANLRRDGSSRFGRNQRYGIFPSVSVGWRLSNEAFLSDVAWLSNLKLRAGWGQLGNDQIPDYYPSSLVDETVGYTFGNPQQAVRSYAVVARGDANRKWETSATTNVGLDVSLWKDRLSFTADYFIRRTSDMLVPVPLPLAAGKASAPYVNAGDVENRGLELSLGYQSNDGPFTWSVDANFTTIHNEVLSLGSGEPISGGLSNSQTPPLTRTEPGYPIGSFYLYVADGLFQDQSEIDAHAFQAAGTAPGDIRFRDLNDDGVIDGADRMHIGSPFPDFSYGLTATAGFRGFDLRAFVQGVQGNDLYNYAGRISEDASRPFNSSAEILERWTGPGTSNSMPRVVLVDENNNTRNSTRFLEDGSYLRLKNVTLGYTLPASWLEAAHLSQTRVYFSVQNAFTLTNYPGLDPEMGTNDNDRGQNDLAVGIDWGTYPQPRIYTLGLNLSF